MGLISLGILSMNRGFYANDLVMRNSKITLMATSLASSKIEEASGKAFDARSADSLLSSTSGLTPAAGLGTEPGETYPNFNDFDDFNNAAMDDTIDGGGPANRIPFRTTCRVFYVDPGTPDAAQPMPTWHKKIVVTVTSPAMSDTVTQQYINSYFHFE